MSRCSSSECWRVEGRGGYPGVPHQTVGGLREDVEVDVHVFLIRLLDEGGGGCPVVPHQTVGELREEIDVQVFLIRLLE